MNIPKFVRIGGIEHEIKYEQHVIRDNQICYGSISYDENEIVISEDCCRSHEKRCVTLWHEILHGIQQHAGLEIENEEAVIDMFAKGIFQVLQDNEKRFFDAAP